MKNNILTYIIWITNAFKKRQPLNHNAQSQAGKQILNDRAQAGILNLHWGMSDEVWSPDSSQSTDSQSSQSGPGCSKPD